MRKKAILIPLALCFVCFASCDFSSSGTKDDFTLVVEVDGVGDGEVLIFPVDNSFVDTGVVSNGKLEFSKTLKHADHMYIALDLKKRLYKDFVATPGDKIVITGSLEDLDNLKVTGSANSQILYDMAAKAATESGKISDSEIRNIVQSNPDPEQLKKLRMMSQAYEIALGKLYGDYIKNNPTSDLSPIFLHKEQDKYPVEELEAIYVSMKEALPDNRYLDAVEKKIQVAKNTMIGAIAPEIKLPNTVGDELVLSEVYKKHKYTLIDFWASWCGPCRMENPHVVKAYNDFKDKGLTIFNISLDKSKSKWLDAIKADGLVWENHVASFSPRCPAATSYGVRGIPANFLVDQEGKIVAKNLRGKALEEKLAELLN